MRAGEHPISEHGKYPVSKPMSHRPAASASGAEKKKQLVIEPGQQFPTVKGKPVVGNDEDEKSVTADPVLLKGKVVSEPTIRGRWVIQAGPDEYTRISDNPFNGIPGLMQVERTAKEMHFYTPNYEDEEKVKSTYAAIKKVGIPPERILGYQREIDAKKEEGKAEQTPNFFMYDSNGKLTPYGEIIQRINQVSKS